jgi:tRNA(Ile)-lysidine synthase
MGPHPAVAEVRSAVRHALGGCGGAGADGGGGGGPVFVACSGGADSLALAAALAFEAPRAGRPAGLITIDHGLQDGSEQQGRRVAALGYELGLDPVQLIRVDVGATGGPEAAARTARYAALDAVATASDAVVLLGHTLDDQAETVLLGLGRGSGPRSIAGMRVVNGRYLRPLLGIRRATTAAACAALGLEPWHDPHNADPRYQRVRLRTELLPLLEDILQGGVAAALARTASMLQDDLDALDELAAAHSAGGGGGLAITDVVAMPVAIRSRVLRAWALAGGVEAGALTAHHLGALDALLTAWRGQGPIQLPGGYRAGRSSGTLWLHPASVTEE